MSVALLRMLRGPDPGREYELHRDTIIIGRGSKNEIIIHDNEVSREHCRLVRVLEEYEIHDLNSTNGTFVNGQRLDESGWLLTGGNVIELGDSITLEFIPAEISTGMLLAQAGDIPEKVSPDTRYYLLLKRNNQPDPEVYALEDATISIGRGLDNDIIFQEGEVSRNHLIFSRDEYGYTLEDLGSFNGTYLNGMRVEHHTRLRPGDEIRIGTMLTLWFNTEPVLTLPMRPDEPVGINRKSTDTHELSRSSGTKPDTLPSIPSPLPGIAASLPTTVQPPLPPTEIAIPTPAYQASTPVTSGLVPEQLAGHVFIAYARSQWNELISPMFLYLTDNQVDVWVDQYLVPDTEAWMQAMNQAQSESSCLLAVISPSAMATPYVRRTINYFISREKPILLLYYQPVDRLPMTIQRLPAVAYDLDNPERTFKTLLVEIRRLSASQK